MAADRTAEHLVVTDRGDTVYRLDLLVAPSGTLADLDLYLREIWVDCCDHASCFRDGTVTYASHPDGDFDDPTMQKRLAELRWARPVDYVYDFGTATELRIRRLQPVHTRLRVAPILLAARNDPPRIACACGNEALIIARDQLSIGSTDGAFLCLACLRGHDGDPDQLSPLANSPRMGVCAYAESSADPAGNYRSADRARHEIEELPLRRATDRLRTGTPTEQQTIVADYMRELARSPLLPRTFRAARFADRNIEHFAEPLRAVVTQTLLRWDESRIAPSDAAHVFGIYLLAPIPDGELFGLLAAHLREVPTDDPVWRGAFDSRQPRQALYASLCMGSDDRLHAEAARVESGFGHRAGCLDALVAQYFHGRLDRSTLVAYLHDLADQAVAARDAAFSIYLASVCCTVHPDDLIRPVQRLHTAGLLSDSGVDYLGAVKDLLKVPQDRHLGEVIATGRYQLLHDPVAVLQGVFEQSGWTRHTARPGPAYVRTGPKTGRNAPCPCGSGRKFKQCCGR